MNRVYWDSMLFVYLIERHPGYMERLRQILREMERRGHTLCTSIFTIGEVLTGFYKRGGEAGADHVRELLSAPLVEVLPFTARTADRFARIRSRYHVTPADAIHLATAAEMAVDLFLTNDRKVANLAIDNIDRISGLDTSLY